MTDPRPEVGIPTGAIGEVEVATFEAQLVRTRSLAERARLLRELSERLSQARDGSR